jgi:hypothetical protein
MCPTPFLMLQSRYTGSGTYRNTERSSRKLGIDSGCDGRAGSIRNGVSVSSFDARLRMPGKGKIPMSVVVDISDDRIAFMSGSQALVDWPLNEVDVDLRADGFYLKRDHEEVVLSVLDAEDFAGALGVSRPVRSTPVRPISDATAPAATSQNGFGTVSGFASRLENGSPAGRFDEIRRQIDGLVGDVTNESVDPSDVFGRWLRSSRPVGRGCRAAPFRWRSVCGSRSQGAPRRNPPPPRPGLEQVIDP